MGAEINTKSMAEGNLAKLILAFAVPLMLGNIFQQLYTFVDTVVVGKALGVNALAALGATEWMIFFVMGGIQGLTHGFSIVIAQLFGKQDFAGLKKAVICAALLSVLFTIAFTILGQLLLLPALHVLNVPGELLPMAEEYLRIIYLGIPINFAYNLMSAILRALGNSQTPLKAITISSLCNGVMDICFVMVFHWGIRGAALATVIAEVISVIYCFSVLRNIQLLKLHKSDFQIEKSIILQELKLGLPLGLQNTITAAGGLVVQSIINSFGVIFIAGYTAAIKLYGLLEIPASSYGYAMSTFSGQNAGAGLYHRVKKGLYTCMIICVFTAVIMSCIMLVGGDFLVSCFLTGNLESVGGAAKIAHDFLFILAMFFPLLYLLYTLRGCIQGLGNSVFPMASSFVQLVMRVGCAVFLTKVVGEYGVFWGEIFAWAGAGLLLLFGFFWLMYSRKSFPEMNSQ